MFIGPISFRCSVSTAHEPTRRAMLESSDPTRPEIDFHSHRFSSPHELPREIERSTKQEKKEGQEEKKIILVSLYARPPPESMEIRAQPTSMRLAPPPASASFRRTPLRTSFLKGNGACFDFVSHFYILSVLWGDWYLRLLCGESIRAPNPLTAC